MPKESSFFTEEQVIEAVCRELKARSYEILSTATVTRHGHDIIAKKGGTRLLVEAKGAGSSKPGTARFGQQFSAGQVFDHVAKAVLKALRVVSNREAKAGIALPDNADHRREIDQVSLALKKAGIAIFWVRPGPEVSIDSPWTV